MTMIYEYKKVGRLVICTSREQDNRINEIINGLADEGWEPTSVQISTGGGGFPYLDALFRRPKQTEDAE
jgi:hypothetical protein